MKKNTRQLAAVMFADMVGYTALMQEDEQRAISNRDRHREIMERSVKIHHGTILQYYGDGTLCIFHSAIDAVNCASEIQQALQEEPKIPLRIGLHTGDVVYSEDGIYGDAVNIASRIETLAIPGCVLISGKVYDEIKNHPSISVTSLGEFDLKNVKKPISIFSLRKQGLTVPSRGELNSKPRETTKSIAVLPFVNMSHDEENEYFSDGITEEILNVLTGVDGLQVTSRTSSFAFKGKNLDVREIGSKLNVTSVLEGSVRKAGERVRITAQLINSADGYHLWSETWDRDLEDIFAVQDDIAKRISNTLRQKLNIDHLNESIVKRPTDNLEAHNLYLKARFYFNKWNPVDARKAIDLLDQAIALESDFALAHTLLAGCYCLIAAMGQQDTESLFNQAKEQVQKSLELDAGIAESHISLASIKFWNEWDIRGARESCLKGLELTPYYTEGFHLLSVLELSLKNFDAAIAAINKALQLDPLALPLYTSAVLIFTCVEKYDEALDYCEKALEYDANFLTVLEGKGWIYILTGKTEKAMEVFKKLHQFSPNPHRALSTLGYTHALKGESEKANQYLQQLMHLQDTEKGAKYFFDLAIVHAGLNEHDQAFENLDKAVEARVGALFIHVHPGWKPYRSDTRFKAIVKKAGFPE